MITAILKLPMVQSYVTEICSDPSLEELYETDLVALARLEKNPGGNDWADFDGSEVINGFWFNACQVDEQTRLAKVCHLRAVAWAEVRNRYFHH